MKSIVLLLLIASASAQSAPPSSVRDPFRRVAQRATLAILRMKFPADMYAETDETERDAAKSLDEVKIEANSPEEDAVFKLLLNYKMSVYMNNVTLLLLDSQLKLDIQFKGLDTEAAYYKANYADRTEIYNRQLACSDAIEDMLRHKLSAELPPCTRVILERKELRTRLSN